VKTKICKNIACRKKKPISEFYARRDIPDGLNSWCKDCCNERERTRRMKKNLSESYWQLGDAEAKDFVNWNDEALYVW